MNRGPRHAFSCRLVWTGEGTTSGYRDYGRALRVDFDGKPSLDASAAPAFRGDGARHNPEDLMVAALSACHCLSYLALCARAGLQVVAYEDAATGELALVDGGLQFVDVLLRPRVTLAPGADIARAERLHASAHDACFIARSVNFPVRHQATALIRASEEGHREQVLVGDEPPVHELVEWKLELLQKSPVVVATTIVTVGSSR